MWSVIRKIWFLPIAFCTGVVQRSLKHFVAVSDVSIISFIEVISQVKEAVLLCSAEHTEAINRRSTLRGGG